jgi:hypothetical protein
MCAVVCCALCAMCCVLPIHWTAPARIPTAPLPPKTCYCAVLNCTMTCAVCFVLCCAVPAGWASQASPTPLQPPSRASTMLGAWQQAQQGCSRCACVQGPGFRAVGAESIRVLGVGFLGFNASWSAPPHLRPGSRRSRAAAGACVCRDPGLGVVQGLTASVAQGIRV